MTPSETGHAALAVRSRRRLLEVLTAAPEPMDAAELAAAVGLHVTTARFHLDVLERAGMIRREAEHAGRLGRPRQLYSAVTDPRQEENPHRQLAEVMAGALAEDPGTRAGWAERAGRWWAEHQVPVEEDLSWEEGTQHVRALFDRLGFAPRLVDDAAARHLELGACPFRDVARAHPQIVCTMHLGLLRGALGRLRVDCADQAGLRPFVEPQLCVVDIPRPPRREEALCPGSI